MCTKGSAWWRPLHSCVNSQPHTPRCPTGLHTIQSSWHWCPQGWHHRLVQKPLHHMGVAIFPRSSVYRNLGMSQDGNPSIRSSMVSQTRAWCQSCELASQLTQQIRDRKPSSNHSGGTRKPRQRGLTSGQWWSCGKKKEASHTQTWPLKCMWRKSVQESGRWSERQAVENLLWHSQQRHKRSTLLQRFAKQSNQNNLDERAVVWKGLNRTLTEAGSNDNLVTELKFTDALSGLSKVKYSGIKGLSVDDRTGSRGLIT